MSVFCKEGAAVHIHRHTHIITYCIYMYIYILVHINIDILFIYIYTVYIHIMYIPARCRRRRRTSGSCAPESSSWTRPCKAALKKAPVKNGGIGVRDYWYIRISNDIWWYMIILYTDILCSKIMDTVDIYIYIIYMIYYGVKLDISLSNDVFIYQILWIFCKLSSLVC